MTYEESGALMTDVTFRSRVKVACLKFANSIYDEPQLTPAHATRLRWAATCYGAPDQTAMTITPPVVMDAAVQSAGADITDDALQGAVETVIGKVM